MDYLQCTICGRRRPAPLVKAGVCLSCAEHNHPTTFSPNGHCAVCGRDFERKRMWQRHCSKACQKAAHAADAKTMLAIAADLILSMERRICVLEAERDALVREVAECRRDIARA